MEITPVLWTYYKAKDGLFPIKIRIAEGDQPAKYVPKNGIARIKKQDWDGSRVKDTHPDYRDINKRIADLIHQAEVDNLKSPGQHSAGEVADSISSQGDFYYYFQKTIDEARARGAHTRADVNESMLSVFRSWRKTWPLKEMTVASVKSLKAYLESKGNSQNTVSDKLSRIRTVVKKLPIDNPFLHIPLKFEETEPKALSGDDLEKLRGYRVPVRFRQMKRAKDIWLFSFNAAGVRWGDLCRLRVKNIVDGRLEYKMHKTGKKMSIHLSREALKIAAKYSAGKNPEDYLFPILDVRLTDEEKITDRIKNADRNYNRSLEYLARNSGMSERPRMHDARHTVANNIETTRQAKDLLGHASERTTEIYRRKLQVGQHDEALRAALSVKNKK